MSIKTYHRTSWLHCCKRNWTSLINQSCQLNITAFFFSMVFLNELYLLCLLTNSYVGECLAVSKTGVRFKFVWILDDRSLASKPSSHHSVQNRGYCSSECQSTAKLSVWLSTFLRKLSCWTSVIQALHMCQFLTTPSWHQAPYFYCKKSNRLPAKTNHPRQQDTP